MDVRQAHYQESKERIHRALLNRLNLDRLTRVGRAQAEPEIRSLILSLLDTESRGLPLSLVERDALITDVLNELFGLGPLDC
jgi:pilus assembly protein CpaF